MTWVRTRVDRVATVNARIGWKALTASEYQPDGFVFLATPNIKSESIDFDNVNYISEFRYDESPELKLQRGDVLLAKDGNTLGITNVVRDLPRPATVNGSIAVLRPFDVESRFLRYALASSSTQGTIEAIKGGMGVPHLFQWDIKRLALDLPPLDAQRSIADYLDRETVRLDALIKAKQRMMNLLEEQRRSAIEHLLWGYAEHLRPVTTLRRVASRIDVGIAEAATHAYEEAGVPLLRSMNIRENAIDSSDLLFIAPWFAERNRSKYIYTNDILTVRTGSVGVSALVPDRFDRSQCFTQLITTIAPPHSAKFVSLALNSQRAREYFQLTGWGSAQANISVPILGSTPIPVTDPAIQPKIAEQAYKVNETCEKLVDALASQLSLLAERRQALIAAAVTGQIQIPEST